MSHLTDLELLDLDLSGLDRSTPFMITGVRYTQFSIARHYGGIKFNGKFYSYIPATDELIREDVVKWLSKQRKAEKKPKVIEPDLFA